MYSLVYESQLISVASLYCRVRGLIISQKADYKRDIKEKSRAKENKVTPEEKRMHLRYNVYTRVCISIRACVWHQHRAP